MEKLLKQLLEVASEKKDTIRDFKTLAVKCQQFELACQLREIETTKFTISQEEKDSIKLSDFYKSLGVNIPPRDIYFLTESLKLYENNINTTKEDLDVLRDKIKLLFN